MRYAYAAVCAALLLPAAARAEEEHPLGRAQEILAEVAPHVEAACGAKFESPPRVVALSETAAQAVFAEDMRPEFERRYAARPEGQREGLLKLAAQTSVRSCLARYSFGTRNIIVVREGFDTQCRALGATGERARQLLLVSLAHECVHALDDARFSLSKLYRSVADDEALRAVAMVAEGRAVHYGRIAATAAGAPKDLADLLPGGAEPRGEREWQANLTYRLGARFVAALTQRGGNALADRAIATPPASTWHVCTPSRWPDGRPDPRPLQVLEHAGMKDAGKPLSELQLLERYAAMHGLETAEKLFAAHLGGAQALVEGTNSAVLAFADEEAAERFAEVSEKECPTARRGTLVVRSLGTEQNAALEKLAASAEAVRRTN